MGEVRTNFGYLRNLGSGTSTLSMGTQLNLSAAQKLMYRILSMYNWYQGTYNETDGMSEIYKGSQIY